MHWGLVGTTCVLFRILFNGFKVSSIMNMRSPLKDSMHAGAMQFCLLLNLSTCYIRNGSTEAQEGATSYS